MSELYFHDDEYAVRFIIANEDELSIEAELLILIQIQQPKDWDEREIGLRKHALREIDRLKVLGEYAAERGRLADLKPKIPPGLARLVERAKPGEFDSWTNFSNGLRSPDPNQRERFKRLYEEIEAGDKTPREIWHILVCLEPAKKKGGRPSVSPPWRNEAEIMDVVRTMVANGATAEEAARAAAKEEGRAGQDRPHDLARLYRRKMRLRE